MSCLTALLKTLSKHACVHTYVHSYSEQILCRVVYSITKIIDEILGLIPITKNKMRMKRNEGRTII